MRFLYAIVAALGWLVLYAKLGLPVSDNNTMWLTLAIIMAGAMAGGD